MQLNSQHFVNLTDCCEVAHLQALTVVGHLTKIKFKKKTFFQDQTNLTHVNNLTWKEKKLEQLGRQISCAQLYSTVQKK